MTNHAPMLQLPQYQTSLVGRTRSFETLMEYVTAGEHLISLVGSSGAGKTRLALQLAQELSENYDRVTFVALAPVRRPLFVVPTIAQALGVREAGQQSLVDVLVSTFAEQRLLLLLDNFEQVVEAGSTLTTLLERMPQLMILVTSQVPLEVAAETVFEVPPLSIPPAKQLDVETALSYSAVRLFVERIKVVQPQFKFQTHHVAPVVEICQLVRGLPLAIELVAAHSKVLDPVDLVMLVRNHLAMGRSLRTVTSISRQELLWPVLDWCHRMLDPTIRTLFDRLGVFGGGCTVESATAVCNAANDLQVDIQTGLQVLIDKHLLQAETLPSQQTRYIMLDAVHEYSVENLHRQRGMEELYRQHAIYYAQLAAQARQGMVDAQQTTWFQHLNEDIHNLRRALDWSLNNGEYSQALQIAANLLVFWQRQGYLSEGRRWLEQGLEQAEAVPSEVLADARNALGILVWVQGDLDQAQALFEQVLGYYQQTNDVLGMGKIMTNLGNIQYMYGKYPAARDMYLESMEYLRRAGEPVRLAMVMNNLGVMYGILGDDETSWHYKNESLKLQRDVGSQTDIAGSLTNLAIDAIKFKRYSQALEYLQEGYDLLKDSHEQLWMGSILANLALVKWYTDESAEAQRYATESVYMCYEASDYQQLPGSLIVFTTVYAQQHPALMTRMLAAMQADLDQRNTPVLPHVQQLYDDVKQALQQQLGTHWQTLWDQGRATDLGTLLAEFEQAAA